MDFDVGVRLPKLNEESFQLIRELRGTGARVEVEEFSNEPQASISLLVGAAALFISRKYFESFLEEAGRDHYELFKRGINHILSMRKRYRLRSVVGANSPNKPVPPEMPTALIGFSEGAGRSVQFMFTDILPEAEETAAIERLCALLREYCADSESPRTALINRLMSLGPHSWRYALIYNPESDRWEPFDMVPRQSSEPPKEANGT